MFEGNLSSTVAHLRRLVRRSGLVLVGTAVVVACGCFPTPSGVVISDGNPILLEDIDPIVNDGSLSEEEKREALGELGLTEELIDILLRAA